MLLCVVESGRWTGTEEVLPLIRLIVMVAVFKTGGSNGRRELLDDKLFAEAFVIGRLRTREINVSYLEK